MGAAGPQVEVALGEAEFGLMQRLIYEVAGININPARRQLVESRLRKRIATLGLRTFRDYHDRIRADPDGPERQELINAITTNKTSFFREEHHFRYLKDVVLAGFRAAASRTPGATLRIWSAGCSTGQEPYSIAITLRDHLLSLMPGARIELRATDIDTQVLARAEDGRYSGDALDGLTPAMLDRHFVRDGNGYRARDELRRLIQFRPFNLTDWSAKAGGPFDAIFCRNVMIYFDAPTRAKLVDRFTRALVPGGHLFLGHSESLMGMSSPLKPTGVTVYRNPGGTAQRHDHGETLPTHRIQAGDFFASREPTRVSTLLGSCVSACLFDPVAEIGGMNHFLLPDGSTDPARPARYGVHAMELLINRIMTLGGQRNRLRAKVVGAASILRHMNSSVPQRNAEFIRSFLRDEHIPIVAERLGGERPIEAAFITSTGQLFVREASVRADNIARDEQTLEQALNRQMVTPPPTSSVELF